MNRKDSRWNHPIDGYLAYLRGQRSAPDLGGLTAHERATLADLFCTLDAITDMGIDLPSMADDPARPSVGELRRLEHGGARRSAGPQESNRPCHASSGASPSSRSATGPFHREWPVHRRRWVLRPMLPRTPRLRRLVLSGAVVPLVLLLVAGMLVLPQPSEAIAVVSLAGARCDDLPVETPGQVVVAAVWSGEERRRFVEVLERFRRRTGIDVTFATDPPAADRDIGGTLDDLSDRGCAPDLALLPQPGLMADLANRHRLVPIEDVVGKIVDESYSPAWRKLGSVDDTLYGAWFKAADKSTI